MKNTLQDLNNYLFEAIERINDNDLDEEGLEQELKRADTTVKVGGMIVANAKLQLDACKFSKEYGLKSKDMPQLLTGGADNGCK